MKSRCSCLWAAAKAILVLSLSCICLCNGPRCSAGDSKAMLEFRAGFTDPGGIFATWQPRTSYCTWNGVRCSKNGRVRALSILAPSPIRGPTPRRDPAYAGGDVGASLRDLSDLVSLEARRDSVRRPHARHFRKLEEARDSGSQHEQLLGHPVPFHRAATALKSLFISAYGPYFPVGLRPAPIPLSFCNLVDLRSLRLNFGLNGIPSCLCALRRLTGLDLSGNSMISRIPNCIGSSLSKLRSLNLADNEFSGAIPKMFGNLTKLQELRLNQNVFSFSIPSEIGRLVNLEILDLSNNSLSGRMPGSLGGLKNLTINKNQQADSHQSRAR
ncbi:hypothetical protein Mapa_000717 [Marchantia paleacea]|nr:hypothetical protein Mapa_000717 [Marchantia paleacea]